MEARDVVQYLRENPEFFETCADEIAEIFVPHPHGGHAIPIAERQILTLREKNAEMTGKLAELVRFGGENDATSARLHRATLALFAAPDLETTLAVLTHSLAEDFAVPQVAVRLWGRVPEQSYLPELAATSAEVREHAAALDAPQCGGAPVAETREWFEGGEAPASFAYLPLRTATTFGILVLASPDPQRFHAGIGTVYLVRLAELASVAIARFLPGM
ncbi:MAG: DUF484 family protein [Betaproteobacteria bacterium]|jgi:uncharacterized protein YigA (DUF484 family)|nr:DUF484 family protein [Betaproteobacteria bacterium]MDH5287431.1 DUF484 family protein [Betaproteobacteria bacterium]